MATCLEQHVVVACLRHFVDHMTLTLSAQACADSLTGESSRSAVSPVGCPARPRATTVVANKRRRNS